MKKRIFSILLCVCLMLSSCILFAACKEETPPVGQITMQQIEDVMNASELPTVENDVLKRIVYFKENSENLLRWLNNFERQNVDSTEFMAMDYFCYENEAYKFVYRTYIFKFTTVESATNCYTNYEFEEEYSKKQYGNLIVVADNKVSDYVFAIIDGIQPK